MGRGILQCRTAARSRSCRQLRGLATWCWISDQKCWHLALPHSLHVGGRNVGQEAGLKVTSFPLLPWKLGQSQKRKKKKLQNVFLFTSEIHLVGRRAVCLLLRLVTGNCDVLERAPVLLVPFQRQLLGSVNYRTGNHLSLQKGRRRTSSSAGKALSSSTPPGFYRLFKWDDFNKSCLSASLHAKNESKCLATKRKKCFVQQQLLLQAQPVNVLWQTMQPHYTDYNQTDALIYPIVFFWFVSWLSASLRQSRAHQSTVLTLCGESS